MSEFVVIQNGKNLAATLFLLASFVVFGNMPLALAHGGEDHGESKAKTTTGEKGIVSHTSRLGDLEIMVKHPSIEPDTSTNARLFITNFQTNAPADKVSPAVEIESANGSVTVVAAEKNDLTGSYSLKIPALPAGTYTLRAKVTYAGETDTATFSGIQVENAPALSTESSTSWGQTMLFVLVSLIVFLLFGGLIYFAYRAAKSPHEREEIVAI